MKYYYPAVLVSTVIAPFAQAGSVFNVEFSGTSGLHYFVTGAGSANGKGTFTSDPQTFSIEGEDAGMGIELGRSDPSTGKGNSKFECYFPKHPSTTSKPYCDISFVDGYSVSMSCGLSNGAQWENANSQTIGYGGDLFSNGNACNAYDADRLLCANNGAEMSILEPSKVADPNFFTPADAPYDNSGSEVFWNSINAYPYDPTEMPTIQCAIKVPKYPAAKRDVTDAETNSTTIADTEPSSVHRHLDLHRKRSRLHARSLLNVINEATV